MKKTILFSLLFTGVLLSSCYDYRNCDEPFGPEEVFVHHSRDIEALYLDCNVDVQVYNSRNPRVEVIGAANIVSNLDIIFHGRSLTIAHNGCIRNRDIRVEVYTPGLYKACINGSGDINFWDYNDVRRSELDIRGSGDIQYMGDSRELFCLIDGSGDIALAGTTEDLHIEIDGSGDIEAFDLQSNFAFIEVDGSGDCEVWVEKRLDVDIHGSGDVYFIGYPDLSVRDHGSGDVIDVN